MVITIKKVSHRQTIDQVFNYIKAKFRQHVFSIIADFNTFFDAKNNLRSNDEEVFRETLENMLKENHNLVDFFVSSTCLPTTKTLDVFKLNRIYHTIIDKTITLPHFPHTSDTFGNITISQDLKNQVRFLNKIVTDNFFMSFSPPIVRIVIISSFHLLVDFFMSLDDVTDVFIIYYPLNHYHDNPFIHKMLEVLETADSCKNENLVIKKKIC
ncbi:hypothetical protein DLEV_069 [Diachasmimorpha longicaudata entomopoxvirus]|uniref:Uncharacterized protein n=1 Tax=Diachasmimorpha longicaudata entomopoxvirus TaxID=109981 RepID=A0A7R5WG14_9POXV|nr:hypothetical protein QKK69_gp069 [Diachasmimorpha longicaudata entomopoxvirus]AKS26360.1 hypothetical protein DLEV_069 [Diachasmimorpha longicaudata entomopoxvirus]